MAAGKTAYVCVGFRMFVRPLDCVCSCIINFVHVPPVVQLYLASELELELIQTHMTQKPMLRVKVGARALRVSIKKMR